MALTEGAKTGVGLVVPRELTVGEWLLAVVLQEPDVCVLCLVKHGLETEGCAAAAGAVADSESDEGTGIDEISLAGLKLS